MNRLISYSVISLFLLIAGCSGGEKAMDDAEDEKAPRDLGITVEVNDRFRFDFDQEISPADSSYWTGTATEFTTTQEGEKVVQGRFRSANDSTWQDFNLFVEYLKLFDLPDQSAIPGRPASPANARLTYTITLEEDGDERVLIYKNPFDDLQKYWQSQNIYVFISYIENELRWIPNPVESPDRDGN